MKTIKKVRAPVRLDFAGGTTDIALFADKYGGAVLNSGINRYVIGEIMKDDKSVHLEYTGHTPTSSGLGTSGVMNLVWLALISQIKMKRKGGVSFKTKTELAEGVYALEQAMGIVGGKQDQYAGAFGGINFLEFKKGNTRIEQLKLKSNFVKELESKLVLVYSGKPHFAGNSNRAMMDDLRKGKNVQNLLRIRDIAIEMRRALIKEDLDSFSDLLNEETENRKRLHRNILPPNVSNLVRLGYANGAKSAKICGSGNGGSVLFYGNKEKLKKKFSRSVIDFKFDFDGLTWL